jgi:hypothetical protein
LILFSVLSNTEEYPDCGPYCLEEKGLCVEECTEEFTKTDEERRQCVLMGCEERIPKDGDAIEFSCGEDCVELDREHCEVECPV